MREAIFITGTGKSGTTIVSKAFFDAGAPMGELSELSTFEGGGGNIKGVWEHQQAMDLNEAILRENGVRWYDTPPGPLSISGSLRDQLQAFIDARPEPRFFLKDPRFVWTAEVWAPLLERVQIIACFRSPLGFAKSASRVMPEIFDPEDPRNTRALRTWVDLNRQLLTLSGRHGGTFFCFDDSPLQMRATLQNLLQHHDLPFDEEAFERFFVQRERHFSGRDTLSASEQLRSEVTDLWRALEAAAFSRMLVEPQPQAELVRLRHKHETVVRLYDAATARLARERLAQAQVSEQARRSAEAVLCEARAALEQKPEHGGERATAPAGTTRAYDIIVPCYNAPELTRLCLDSLLASTGPEHRIWLLDDQSPDARVAPLLAAYADAHAQVTHLRAERNGGFPATVNWGLSLTDRDVVIVNNDTEFTPGWLERLDRCRASSDRLAAISPLSNNATICSVPQLNGKNVLPDGTTLEAMAAHVAELALCSYPRVPTVVGFCMLMSRAAIDAIGGFDEGFGLGYGEEVDWCQRAWMAGFECALCDDAYVYHHGEAGQASAGRVKERQRANEELVAARWPDYHNAVYQTCMQDPLRGLRLRLHQRLHQGHDEGEARPRLMQVVHAYHSAGGTEHHTRDLVEANARQWAVSVLFPEPPGAFCDVRLSRDDGGAIELAMNRAVHGSRHLLRSAPAELRSPRVERLFADALASLRPDVVHFQHLIGFGSFLLPAIARAAGARVVLTLHDYFLLCPDWNLIGPRERDCNQRDASSCTEAVECLSAKQQVADGYAPPPLTAYLTERKRWARVVLEAAHVIVVPSQYVKDRFSDSFGADIGDRILVVPHGTRPFELPTPAALDGAAEPARPSTSLGKGKGKGKAKARRKPKALKHTRPANDQGAASGSPDTLRVAFLGNFDLAKGAEVFLAAAERVMDLPVELEVVGASNLKGQAPANVRFSGRYTRAELPARLAGVDAVVVPSIWHETYCYTVDEALRLGIPVIASRGGAIAERIEEGREGLLFELADVEGLVRAIRRFATDAQLRQRMKAAARAAKLRDHEGNMQAYRTLYQRLLPQAPADPSARTRLLMDQARKHHHTRNHGRRVQGE